MRNTACARGQTIRIGILAATALCAGCKGPPPSRAAIEALLHREISDFYYVEEASCYWVASVPGAERWDCSVSFVGAVARKGVRGLHLHVDSGPGGLHVVDWEPI